MSAAELDAVEQGSTLRTKPRGPGVLLVEQHVDLALAIADRAYVLSHGDLVLENDAQHLPENRHLLEARYVGGPGAKL